jgi:hypothetical protein
MLSGARNILIPGIVVSILFVIVGVFWLSYSMETLDHVAEQFGASDSPIWNPLIPDYEIRGLEGNPLSNTIVGIVFTLVTLTVAFAVGKCLRSSRNKI